MQVNKFIESILKTFATFSFKEFMGRVLEAANNFAWSIRTRAEGPVVYSDGGRSLRDFSDFSWFIKVSSGSLTLDPS